MKHLTETEIGLGYSGVEGITLTKNTNIVSFAKVKDTILITEECDGFYSVTYTKQEMLELIEELKEWIQNEKID